MRFTSNTRELTLFFDIRPSNNWEGIVIPANYSFMLASGMFLD